MADTTTSAVPATTPTGWRKIIVFTEALAAFVIIVMYLGIQEAAVLVALGLAIGGLLTAAIYGNIQEHKTNANVAIASIAGVVDPNAKQ